MTKLLTQLLVILLKIALESVRLMVKGLIALTIILIKILALFMSIPARILWGKTKPRYRRKRKIWEL